MEELIVNKILLSTVVSTVLAQLIKTLIDSLEKKEFQFFSLFRGAGMPSSHTATVVALTLSVFLIEGVNTVSIITLIFSAIFVRDVIGDRIFATHQQNLINTIIEDISKHRKIKRNHLIGHTELEVFFGIIVGVFGVILVF